MNRKLFLQKLSIGTASVIAVPIYLKGQSTTSETKKREPLPAEKVKEFVLAGHGNFEKVKTMLLEFPSILYATWDWKDGDFETAIEGAGHVGNKEIANYLIAAGARTNMFVLTMLGKTQIVKPFLETYPAYINARGPHGLTLLHHAQKGGEDAKELLDFIESKGLKETKMTL
jgi:hypothetical protein